MRSLIVFLLFLQVLNLFGQEAAKFKATHIKLDFTDQSLSFLSALDKPGEYSIITSSFKEKSVDSLIFDKTIGFQFAKHLQNDEKIIPIESILDHKYPKKPFSKPILYQNYRDTFEIEGTHLDFITATEKDNKSTRVARYNWYKIGEIERIPIILDETANPDFILVWYDKEYRIFSLNPYHHEIRGATSLSYKNLYAMKYNGGQKDENYERITPDTTAIFFKGTVQPLATFIYDKARDCDHFSIFKQNGMYSVFFYANPVWDTNTSFRAYHLESNDSPILQVLQGNEVFWLDSMGRKTKPIKQNTIDAYKYLQYIKHGIFVYKNPFDVEHISLDTIVRVMIDSLTVDTTVRAFESYDQSTSTLPRHDLIIGFDISGHARLYTLKMDPERFIITRMNENQYQFCPKEKPSNPCRYQENGLIGFFPGTLNGKYIKLAEFEGGFARFEKPDHARGWVNLKGKEFLDLKPKK